MDAIDNLMFATLQSQLTTGNLISSSYLSLPAAFGTFAPVGTTAGGTAPTIFNFDVDDKFAYTSFFDHCVIEESIRKHWYDVNGNILAGGVLPPGGNFLYTWTGLGTVSNFTTSSTYHMFYAFLLENTRIVQIFEKVIEKYVYDEELGVAPADVRQWLLNSESLFFKDGGCRPDNTKSYIRPDVNKNRKNAYFRMFGAELAFGESDKGSAASYYKPKTSNQEFIPLFERYLCEVYYAYTHSRDTCCNSIDLNNLRELAIEIRELLACRRGDRPGGALNAYASTSLAIEEFSSVIMMSWFEFIITDNTRVVEFLGCQSSSAGDRLYKIGQKVGINAHAQSQALLEMAGPAANILALIETGTYLENFGNIQTMITSLNGGPTPSPDSELMNAFLILINNWERATGHKLKTHGKKEPPAPPVEVETTFVKKIAKQYLN